MGFRTADSASRHDSLDEVPALTALSYELLDAHADTQRLADAGASEAEWERHLAYLRDLQRVGREALARATQPVGR
jgi:Leu/Phe-tRNA-protein transferase